MRRLEGNLVSARVFVGILVVTGCADAGESTAGIAAAHFTMADADAAKMSSAGEFFCFDNTCTFGLHLSHCKSAGLAVPGADCVINDRYVFISLEQTKRGGKYRVLGVCTDEYEFAGVNFGKESLDSRLVERVGTALVKDDLVVIIKHVQRQIVVPVGREADVFIQKSVVELALAGRSVETIIDNAAAVVIRIYLAGGNNRDVVMPCPGNHPAQVHQDSAVISYARFTLGEKKVLLGADINQDSVAAGFNKLSYH